MKRLITILLIAFVACIHAANAQLKPVNDGPLTLFYETEITTQNRDGTYRHVWEVSVNAKEDRVIKIYNVTCNGDDVSETGIKLGINGFYTNYSFICINRHPTEDWVYDLEVEGPTGSED